MPAVGRSSAVWLPDTGNQVEAPRPPRVGSRSCHRMKGFLPVMARQPEPSDRLPVGCHGSIRPARMA